MIREADHKEHKDSQTTGVGDRPYPHVLAILTESYWIVFLEKQSLEYYVDIYILMSMRSTAISTETSLTHHWQRWVITNNCLQMVNHKYGFFKKSTAVYPSVAGNVTQRETQNSIANRHLHSCMRFQAGKIQTTYWSDSRAQIWALFTGWRNHSDITRPFSPELNYAGECL